MGRKKNQTKGIHPIFQENRNSRIFIFRATIFVTHCTIKVLICCATRFQARITIHQLETRCARGPVPEADDTFFVGELIIMIHHAEQSRADVRFSPH